MHVSLLLLCNNNFAKLSYYFLPSAVHSFILDVDDNVIRQHFSKEERDEIEFAPSPQVPEISDEIDEFLNKFIDKVINNLHAIDKIRTISR